MTLWTWMYIGFAAGCAVTLAEYWAVDWWLSRKRRRSGLTLVLEAAPDGHWIASFESENLAAIEEVRAR